MTTFHYTIKENAKRPLVNPIRGSVEAETWEEAVPLVVESTTIEDNHDRLVLEWETEDFSSETKKFKRMSEPGFNPVKWVKHNPPSRRRR